MTRRLTVTATQVDYLTDGDTRQHTPDVFGPGAHTHIRRHIYYVRCNYGVVMSDCGLQIHRYNREIIFYSRGASRYRVKRCDTPPPQGKVLTNGGDLLSLGYNDQDVDFYQTARPRLALNNNRAIIILLL